MSDIQALQNSLIEYKDDVSLAKILKDLSLTPSWKRLITEGFLQKEPAKIISKLATASEEDKKIYLASLVGISVFQNYLDTITTQGELAKNSIVDTEASLLKLRGEYNA